MHPGVHHLLRFFHYTHLPEPLRSTSAKFHDLAHVMAADLPSNPELTAALRKLLEAKDCAVRAHIPPDADYIHPDSD